MLQQRAHDPFLQRSLEQILTLFDGGTFSTEVMTEQWVARWVDEYEAEYPEIAAE